MKRSEINQILKSAKAFMAEKQFILPPWANWSVADWKENKEDAHEVIENMLGWDITDFGSGDFTKEACFCLPSGTENSMWTRNRMLKKS